MQRWYPKIEKRKQRKRKGKCKKWRMKIGEVGIKGKANEMWKKHKIKTNYK